jgi:ceramide glucosyltransferase
VLTALRSLILLPALCPLVYYIMATYAGWEYFRKTKKLLPANSKFAPPISLLKPVRGVDREVYENFASMCRLDYSEYEILFAVSEADDPVIPLIEKLQREFPQRSIRLIVGIEQLGTSRKTNSLCRLVREAKHDLLVINDSDVRVEEGYLRDIVAGFSDPRVGVVTTLFRSEPGGDLPKTWMRLGFQRIPQRACFGSGSSPRSILRTAGRWPSPRSG